MVFTGRQYHQGHAHAHNDLGVALAAQGRIDEAMVRYQRALSLKPDLAHTHINLGAALAAKGRIVDAIASYQRALLFQPAHAGALYNLGIALAAQGDMDAAVSHYQRAVAIKPDYADAHNNLGVAFAAQNKSEDAAAHYRKALAANRDHAEAHTNLANILREQGKFDQAMAHYDRAIAIRPDNAETHYLRAEIKTFHAGDADLKALEALARRADLPEDKAPFIHFAMAKALEDTGDFTRAFQHLRKGNDAKRRRIHYDEPAVAAKFQRIPSDRFEATSDPSPVPIFVLGMPRSGSTLIEQILASHPQIQGAGELPSRWGLDGHAWLAGLPPLAEGKIRIVDKLPENFLRVGLIRRMLPNAKIIHSVRDPIDTCVSCYSKLFTAGQNFSYDMGELGRYYRLYEELMRHWKSVLPADAMLDVAYEDVVDDIEGQARRMIDYCGLPWDDRCLTFHKTIRPVKTASAVQVRKPLFRSSLQRWRRFETGIGPLLDALTAEDFHHVRAANAG